MRRYRRFRRIESSNYAVSHPIEFFIGFVIIVAGIFFALFAVSQFFVPEEPEIEQKDFLLKAFILSDHLINDPGNWSITDDSVNVSEFGLAYAGETPTGNNYGVLDSSKLVLLNDKEPNDKYVNYTEAKKILGLKDYEFRMQVVKNGVKTVDFGRTFSNTLTTATVTRNVYVYNETLGVSEPAVLVVTVSKLGEGLIFNNNPVAIDKTVFTDENTPVSFTLNASDDVFDLLTFSIEGSPSNGTLFYDGNPVDSFPYTISTKFLAGNISDRPSITYVPEFNGYGNFTFLFNVSDDYGGWDIGTITLNVGYVPYPIASDYSVALFGGDSIYVDVVSGSDYHPPSLLGSVNLFINSSSIVSSPSNGNVTVINSTTVLYKADEDFSGSDVFEYRLYDDTWNDTLGVLSDVGRVNVNICPVDGWYCNNSNNCQLEWRDYMIGGGGGCSFTVNDSTVQICCNKHTPSGWVSTGETRFAPSSNGCCDIKQEKQEYWENYSYCDSSTQSCIVTHTVTDIRWVNVTPTVYQDNDSACSYKNGWYSNGTRSVPYGVCCDVIQELMEWRDYKCTSCGCTDDYTVNESTRYWRDTGEISKVDSRCSADEEVWNDTGNTRWIRIGTACCEKEQKEQRKYIRDYYCADDCASCSYTDTATSDYRWVDTRNTRTNDSYCQKDDWYDTEPPEYRIIPYGECCDLKQKKQEYRDYYCQAGCTCTYKIDTSKGTNGYRWVDDATSNNDSRCEHGWYKNRTYWVKYGCCDIEYEEWEWREYQCNACSCSDIYIVNDSTKYSIPTGNTNPHDDECLLDSWVPTGTSECDVINNLLCDKEEYREWYCDCTDKICKYTVTNTRLTNCRCVKDVCGATCCEDSDCGTSTWWVNTGTACNSNNQLCTKQIEYEYYCKSDNTCGTKSTGNTRLVSCNCVKGSCGAACGSDSDCPADEETTSTVCNGRKTCKVTNTTSYYCGSDCTCSFTTSTSDPFDCECIKGSCGATCGENGDCSYLSGWEREPQYDLIRCGDENQGCQHWEREAYTCYEGRCSDTCECDKVGGEIGSSYCENLWDCNLQIQGESLACVVTSITEFTSAVHPSCDTYDGWYTGGSCFLADTKVLMSDGSTKNIQDIKPGEYVKAMDMETGGIVNSLVTKVFYHTSDEMTEYYIIINGLIRVTPNHPIYVNNKWAYADEIQIGDELFSYHGNGVTVESLVKVFRKKPTYNLEVSLYHNYFVEGVLVHNKITCTDTIEGCCAVDKERREFRDYTCPLNCPTGESCSYTVTTEECYDVSKTTYDSYCSGGTSCGSWTYYCKNNDVWRKRQCTEPDCYKNLFDNCVCTSNTFWEDYKYIDCSGGCVDGSCQGGGTICFLEGTKIAMANGEIKNIEDIKIGDVVKSFDTIDSVWKTGVVTKVYHHTSDEMTDYYLIINNDLRVTPNHPLYVDGKWIHADDLKIGDNLNGEIFSIQRVYDRVSTYNFEVEPYHNYFVVWNDNSESLAHNGSTGSDKSCCLPGGTKIAMADGTYKNIEDIKIGDIVLTYDTQSNIYMEDVIKITKSKNRSVYNINNGFIKLTDDHPVYVKKPNGEIGWASINPELTRQVYNISVFSLRIGDALFTTDGWIEIKNISHEPEILKTYTLGLNKYHHFFANNVLVHNAFDDPIVFC